MQLIKSYILIASTSIALASSVFTQAQLPSVEIELLQKTRATNIDMVIDTQLPGSIPVDGFSVSDPYAPPVTELIRSWSNTSSGSAALCAVRFLDEQQVEYELRDFETSTSAESAGFTVTHYGRCGSCSTLKDLAVYLSTPDLTTPARQCSRRFGLKRKKQCFENDIGFTPHCAESWAYNARNTKDQCLRTCMADYGILNLIFHRYPGGNIDETGQLRPCLQCDEDKSGPGFKFSAGRTRRNSGIESAIPRSTAEIRAVDHSVYFD